MCAILGHFGGGDEIKKGKKKGEGTHLPPLTPLSFPTFPVILSKYGLFFVISYYLDFICMSYLSCKSLNTSG